jgi:hypothetical protein
MNSFQYWELVRDVVELVEKYKHEPVASLSLIQVISTVTKKQMELFGEES